MNILHITPTYYSDSSVIGGGEKYVLYAAKSLLVAAAERGVKLEVALVAFGQHASLVHFPPRIECHVIEGRPWDATSLKADQIRRVFRDFDVVFVHQCLSAFGLFLAAQAKIIGKLVIGVDHGGGEHPLINRTPESGVLFDHFKAQSAFVSRAFADVYGNVVVVPGPVDDEVFTPGQGGPVDRRKVVALGRIMPHKGFDRIISALPAGLDLHIVGRAVNTEYHAHLLELSKGKSVHLHGDLDDDQVRELLRGAGLFVHASTHLDYQGTYYAKPELLGLAPLEALACGVPTLVSNAGSLPELAVVEGCLTFANDAELAQLLGRHELGEIDWPSPEVIHRDVTAKYGMLAYGGRILDLIGVGKAR